ncbi:MAG: PEGA domain-containing protein [Polyangiaceae bacterium]
MARSWRWLVALQALLLVLGLSTRASAQQKTNAAILGLDSDDAERQADALSAALRSRARMQPGWTISDNTDSIALVTAALRCPSHPDATCEKHIGEQLKTDKFFWGNVRRIGPGQLSAEVHFWQRGKPDSSVKEIFPEATKDATDPNARLAATHIFEKLTGATPLNGSVTIKAGEGEGAVIVDGEQKGSLDHGTTKLDLAPGTHTIEVRASGFEASKQTVNVVASNDALVTMTLVPVAVAPSVPHRDDTATPPDASQAHGKGRLIVGLALIGLGVVAEGIAGYEGLQFLSNRSTWNDFKDKGCAAGVQVGQMGDTQNGSRPGCGLSSGGNVHDTLCTQSLNGSAGCQAYDSAKSSIAPGFIFASAGVVLAGAGVIVILTAPKNSEGPPPPQAGKPTFLPLVGPTVAGMSVGVPF